MERINNSIRNIKYGFFASIISTFMKFFTRTIMIYTIGVKFVGLDSVFLSIIGILNLTELGFSNAVNFSLYNPVERKDYNLINCILNYYKKIYRCIGCLITILGILLVPFLNKIVTEEIPQGQNIYILYFIALFNTGIGYFLFAYKSSIFIVNLKNKEISYIKTILSIVQCILQIIALIKFKSYFLYILITPIITISNNILISIRAKKYFPYYRAVGRLPYIEQRNIQKNVIGLFIQKVGTVVFSSVDNIVISAFLGITEVALYNNYYYVTQTSHTIWCDEP